MSSKPEVQVAEKPKEKEKQTGGKEGKPQERKEGGKPRAEQSEYRVKGEAKEEKPQGEKKPQGDKPQTERRERREGDRKPREPKEPRGDKEQGQGSPDGDKKDGKPRGERRPRTEGGEEQPKRERKERPKREYDQDWRQKIVVTLETEIPALIPEKDRLQQPKTETLTNNLKECDRKIKEYEEEIKKLQAKREDWRKAEKEKKDKERNARLENKQSKEKEWEDNKTLFEDHNVLKKDVEKISKEKKDIEAQLEEINSKLFDLEKQFLTKSAMSLKAVKAQIEDLEYRQMNEKLTGIEEKKIITDLAVLKKSIPIAEQFSKLQDEKFKIREARKVIVEKLNPIFNKKKELGNEIKGILEKRDKDGEGKKKEDGDVKKKDGKDAPDAKDQKGEKGPKDGKDGEKKERPKPDDPFSKKIEEVIQHKKDMYKKKDKLKAEFDEAWNKYHDQRDEIRKVEYMIQQKEHLKRIEDIKERKAKELRDQLIQEYLVENTPKEDAATFYKEDICKIS
jgi:uncharacterized coiled-coil DUF342 family protein